MQGLPLCDMITVKKLHTKKTLNIHSDNKSQLLLVRQITYTGCGIHNEGGSKSAAVFKPFEFSRQNFSQRIQLTFVDILQKKLRNLHDLGPCKRPKGKEWRICSAPTSAMLKYQE